jgi:hypothetical protein
MGQKSLSKSKFLASVEGQAAQRPAAMADPVEGGPAVSDHKVRVEALKKGPFINATPKVSAGPKASVPSFPTLDETQRKAP